MIYIDEGGLYSYYLFLLLLIMDVCSLLVEPRQPADNMEHKTGTMKSSELFGWASRDKS